MEKNQEQDVISLFLSLDHLFGQGFDRETPLFRMYLDGRSVFPVCIKKMVKSIES